MKKLLFAFSLCTMMVSVAFSQDDTYYTGDEATVTEKTQQAPPALPEYTQPPCPEDGYIWTPGYWAWGVTGFYWVPGVWVAPPRIGLLWTPGYWGFYHGFYGWHPGYWGEHIGYYGGINYGFGYYGTGFYGGRWEGGHFRYNTAVWHVNTRVIHNVYESREGVREVSIHASFNGPGGVRYRPAGEEERVMHENHVAATREQMEHRQAAGNDRGQFVHGNNGHPAYHSMSRPGGERYDAGAHAVHAAPHPAPHAAPSHGGGHGRR